MTYDLCVVRGFWNKKGKAEVPTISLVKSSFIVELAKKIVELVEKIVELVEKIVELMVKMVELAKKIVMLYQLI